MGRRPCCSKDQGLNRGAWTAMEDKILRDYIKIHGEGKWRHLPKRAGLKRCGKSCRLRWLNYLRPDIKRGNITRDEEDLIIRLHKLLGNRWSLIAGRLPGRTDNEIKNYWNTNIGKKVQSQPIYSTSNRKPSKQSNEKSRSKIKLEIGQPPSPATASCVVRTKASRCTKVFITTEPQNTKQLDIKTVFGPFINEESPFSSRKDNPYDFIMDSEMDEKFLSEFLNTEFVPLCDSDGRLRGDSSPEFLDLGSMVSLLDPEIDWLQD